MKILFIVPYAPNLIRVRPYNLIRALGQAGHQVTVATLYSNAQELQDANDLQGISHAVIARQQSQWQSLTNCLFAVPSSTPLQAVFNWIPAFAEELENLCFTTDGKRQFDVIHVEHLRGAKYGAYLKQAMQARSEKIPIVWDSVDCISLLFRQAASNGRGIRKYINQFELPRTEKYEGQLVNEFSHVCVTSQNDRAALEKLARSGQPPAIHIIPNGVDLEYFTPGPTAARQPNTLVVSGKMSYHANISMVLYLINAIMPLIWSQNPQARLLIVGKDPAKEIRRLADHPSIQVVGGVPDLRPYLQQASIALTPLKYGVGIQNKVLEAMACGIPVVATSKAVAALSVTPGTEILVADTPAEYAQTVCDLLQDPARQALIGQAGRAYVEHYHNWQRAAQKLEAVYLGADQ